MGVSNRKGTDMDTIKQVIARSSDQSAALDAAIRAALAFLAQSRAAAQTPPACPPGFAGQAR